MERKVPKLALSPRKCSMRMTPDHECGVETSYILHLFFYIFVMYSYCYCYDKKLEYLLIVLILLEVKFQYTQINVPRIDILMSKTACINSCVSYGL